MAGGHNGEIRAAHYLSSEVSPRVCTARSSGSMTILRHYSWVGARPPERAMRVAAATSGRAGSWSEPAT